MNRRFWRRRGDAVEWTVGIGTAILCVSIGLMLAFNRGFRAGQIGALGGNDIRYELVEQNDGSKTWELIAKP